MLEQQTKTPAAVKIKIVNNTDAKYYHTPPKIKREGPRKRMSGGYFGHCSKVIF